MALEGVGGAGGVPGGSSHLRAGGSAQGGSKNPKVRGLQELRGLFDPRVEAPPTQIKQCPSRQEFAELPFSLGVYL